VNPGSAADGRASTGHLRPRCDSAQRGVDSLGTLPVLQAALNAINNQNNAQFIYATRTRAQQLQQRVQRFLNDPQALNQLLTNSWAPICQLFSSGQNRQPLFSYSSQQAGIINMLLGSAEAAGPRPVIVIDISRQGNQRFWSEELQRRPLENDPSLLEQFGQLSNEQIRVTLTEPGENCCTKGPDGGAYFRCLLCRGSAGTFISTEIALTANSIK
jgi:hypothetical protein